MLAVLQVPVSAIGINERGCSLPWLPPQRTEEAPGPGEPTCNQLNTLILVRRTSFISPKSRLKRSPARLAGRFPPSTTERNNSELEF